MSTSAVGLPHPRLTLIALSGTSDDSAVVYKSRVIGSRGSCSEVGDLQHEEGLVEEGFETLSAMEE